MNHNRLLDIKYLYERGTGSVGGRYSSCIDSITADSDPTTFLQQEDIDTASKTISDMQQIFEGIEESFQAIEKESESAFSCDNTFPIEIKSQVIKGSILEIGEDIVNHSTEIETEGNAHRKAEAARYYLKVKERLVDLNKEVHYAITNYNTLLDEKKEDYKEVHSEYDADQKYGGYLYVYPEAPYETSLDTHIYIESRCNYHSEIDGGNFMNKLKAYNECADDKGKKAEQLKKDTDCSPEDYGRVLTTYDSVTSTDAGFTQTSLAQYREKHEHEQEHELDLHYYGTVEVTDPKTGETTRQPVYYDANDHHGTYTGGFRQYDSARLMIIVDGVPCYITNNPQTRSHDDTRSIDGGLEYNVSITTDEDDGTPVDPTYGDPVEKPGSVYANHDIPGNVHIMEPGGWSDNLYIKDEEGNTYNVDWGSIQYTAIVENKDNAE